ncbi:hypothetical protein FK531_04670 [Rhodococcus spelaei]|uniref:Uncharacterized protein n=1 Tax=Rhodococcus spelaei TaxID=2546320 RepID=A0A541BNS7_9NOCA|nr:hypothetical protein [Rhodococcus spelaei]TQF73966.1 hypothetical protein FK531_04670 [Rhodococcus spelaei]
MIDAQTLDVPAGTTTMQTARRWVPGACVWCGDDVAVEMYRNEPRCGTCRENEEIIEGARRFLGMYGLRPLGGTLQSDDEEEREWRVTARDARAALNQTKLASPPDPALVRKALRPRAAAVVAETVVASRASTATGSATRAAATARTTRSAAGQAAVSSDAVDLDEIQARGLALLDQMSSVDAQLAQVADQSGLAARARRSDLEKQKATIMRTLGALEKARQSAQR